LFIISRDHSRLTPITKQRGRKSRRFAVSKHNNHKEEHMQMLAMTAALIVGVLAAHQAVNRTGTLAKVGFGVLCLAAAVGFALAWLKL
jgi:hypothetical protein